MIVRVALFPKRVKTIARFVADDPWTGESTVEWSLEQFRLLAEDVEVQSSFTQPISNDILGLRREADGTIKLFPRSLHDVVQAGQVQPATLPALLFRMQSLISAKDQLVMQSTFVRFAMALFGLLMSLPLVLILYVSGPTLFAFPNFARVKDGRSWLASPMQNGQLVDSSDVIRIYGCQSISAVLVPDEATVTTVGTGYALGWFTASTSNRLILTTPALCQAGVHPLRGFVLAPDEIGLAQSVVREVINDVATKNENPVEEGKVFCGLWQAKAGWGKITFLVLLGLAVMGWSPWAVIVWRRRRYQKQMAWLRGEMKELHG